MTLADTRAKNDATRTTLADCVVLFSPAVAELDARMRGRLIYRISLFDKFSDDSDHSEGVVIFAGFSILWRIVEFSGERCLELLMEQDL